MKSNKKEQFINFIKNQLNVELVNDPQHSCNRHRNILYTEIKSRVVISLIAMRGMRYEKHIGDYYWIWLQ